MTESEKKKVDNNYNQDNREKAAFTTPHKRRKRYSGTHPKKFEEKYKEHDPLKYADTIDRVIAKGSTPAGMHISIMVDEILDVLKIKPGEQGLDATLGYGGHTRAMLERLEGSGHIYGLDVDPIESEKTRERLSGFGFGPEIVTVRLQNFCTIDELVKETGGFDFVLADLGVSSMQIDNPERGFSYKIDGPLDLRMNPLKGESAAERIRNISKEELAGMLMENADEPYAAEIAAEVYKRNKRGKKIETTTDMREAIEAALNTVPEIARAKETEKKEAVKKACARCFQALRIDINQEYEVLYQFMDKLPGILNPGGRVAILTFHSGEDRLVKKAFRDGKKAGLYSYASEDVIRPGAQECQRNPRAKSTKLRYAVKA